MRFLVVEDCEVNRLVVTGFLSKHYKSIEIDYAENGKIGVRKAIANDYDAILMDINMPVMDGITATGLIKKVNSNAVIVAVTAVELDYIESRNALSTFDQILFKPLMYDRFTATLDNVLNYSHSTVSNQL
jgi:CheY-like chemotaxis protein